MSAKFYQRTIKIATGEQITAKFYIASPMDFCIEPTTDSNATNWANNILVIQKAEVITMKILMTQKRLWMFYVVMEQQKK